MNTNNPQNKVSNVIDMAFNFTAMARVFKTGSKKIITERLDITLTAIETIQDEADFNTIHHDFCIWFTENIARSKEGALTSYGHGAKILDVVTKVYFYYCHLPHDDVSTKTNAFLKGAVDGPILRYIRNNIENEITANSIAEIDEGQYRDLQELLMTMKNIEDKTLLIVEYEDLLRYRLS